MSTTIVHLVRHGEVDNPKRVLYGRLPGYHLSARGQSQAARTAQAFRGHDVTYLVASPLQRTQETAQPFAAITGLDVATDPDLIEAGNQLEGRRIKGLRSELLKPTLWPLLIRPDRPSWGEPFADISARMMDAIERARLEAEGHEALVITHQLPIVVVQREVMGLPYVHNPATRQCDLASVTSLVFQDTTITDLYYTEPAREV